MFRDRRAAGAKIGGNLADGAAAAPQQAQDFAAGRIGDRPKHRFVSLASCRDYLVPSMRLPRVAPIASSRSGMRNRLVTNNVTG